MGYYVKRFFGKKIEEPRDPDFVMTVDTRLTYNAGNAYSGTSSSNKFHMPFNSDKNYDCTINWGDNKAPQTYKLKGGSSGVPHTYSSPGVYQIKVSGYVPTIFAVSSPGVKDNRKIISIDNWGINEWDSF